MDYWASSYSPIHILYQEVEGLLMQFVTGEPNLLDQTLLYAIGTTTPLYDPWTEQEIKNAINISYLEIREMGRRTHTGLAEKITLVNSVADQIWYSLPSDFIEMISVELATGGENLSTAVDATPVFLTRALPDIAWTSYHSGVLTSSEFYVLKDDEYGIFAPSGVSGTNSIRLYYGASTALLSNDGDIPDIPIPYHDLIAAKAAIKLRASRDMNFGDLFTLARNLEITYVRALSMRSIDNSSQAIISGRDKNQILPFKTGTIRRLR